MLPYDHCHCEAGGVSGHVHSGPATPEAAIVREMAERGPFTDTDGLTCADCSVNITSDVPANHEPACLWRRAREWRDEVERNV